MHVRGPFVGRKVVLRGMLEVLGEASLPLLGVLAGCEMGRCAM